MSNRDVDRGERDFLRRLRDLHYREQGGLCYFCRVAMTPPTRKTPYPNTMVTIEHLKGRNSGGGSNYLNTAASCFGCNHKRSQQSQVGKRTVPIIKVARKRMFTYAYTTPNDPFVLVLANSSLTQDDAMLHFRAKEGLPITMKYSRQVKE